MVISGADAARGSRRDALGFGGAGFRDFPAGDLGVMVGSYVSTEHNGCATLGWRGVGLRAEGRQLDEAGCELALVEEDALVVEDGDLVVDESEEPMPESRDARELALEELGLE